jgi:hypothetical protein
VLILLAMSAYPGGTAWDPTTRGHDFWQNYLCDLERAVALDGHSNDLGAALARIAMASLGVASLAFWHLLPEFFPERTALGRGTRAFGLVSAIGILAVALLPGDRFPGLHPALMLAAGGPGILAAAVGVVGLATRAPFRGLAALGAGAMVASALDLALYVRQLFVSSPDPVLIAVLERVSLILALAWVGLVALSALRGGVRARLRVTRSLLSAGA